MQTETPRLRGGDLNRRLVDLVEVLASDYEQHLGLMEIARAARDAADEVLSRREATDGDVVGVIERRARDVLDAMVEGRHRGSSAHRMADSLLIAARHLVTAADVHQQLDDVGSADAVIAARLELQKHFLAAGWVAPAEELALMNLDEMVVRQPVGAAGDPEES
jgi:hypothetical protein